MGYSYLQIHYHSSTDLPRKIDSDSQVQWDKLSPKAKNLILLSACQKGIESIINKSTISTGRFRPNGKFPPKTAKSSKPNGAEPKNDRSTHELLAGTQYQYNSRLLAYRSQSTVEPIGLIVSLKLLL
jgi:hypothetical protein